MANSGWGGPGGSAGRNAAGIAGNPNAAAEAAARGYTGPGAVAAFSSGMAPGNYNVKSVASNPTHYSKDFNYVTKQVAVPTTFSTPIPTQTQPLTAFHPTPTLVAPRQPGPQFPQGHVPYGYNEAMKPRNFSTYGIGTKGGPPFGGRTMGMTFAGPNPALRDRMSQPRNPNGFGSGARGGVNGNGGNSMGSGPQNGKNL
jgi:hypothetical protein